MMHRDLIDTSLSGLKVVGIKIKVGIKAVKSRVDHVDLYHGEV